jgi:hypothetical protein
MKLVAPYIKSRVTFFRREKPCEFHSGRWMNFNVVEGKLYGGVIELIDKEVVMFGESIDARIKFMVWDLMKDSVKVGDKYTFRWVHEPLGEIEVLEIFN